MEYKERLVIYVSSGGLNGFTTTVTMVYFQSIRKSLVKFLDP